MHQIYASVTGISEHIRCTARKVHRRDGLANGRGLYFTGCLGDDDGVAAHDFVVRVFLVVGRRRDDISLHVDGIFLAFRFLFSMVIAKPQLVPPKPRGNPF